MANASEAAAEPIASTPETRISLNQAASDTWRLGPAYPIRSLVPFREILKWAMRVDFREGDLERVFRRAIQGNPKLINHINIESAKSGAAFIHRSLIFEEPTYWNLTLFRRGNSGLTAHRAWHIPERNIVDGSWQRLLGKINDNSPRVEQAHNSVKPGTFIARREHASLEIGVRGGQRIIFDPIFRAHHLECALMIPKPDPGLSAAFLTHSHSDHFNLATLHLLAEDGTKIYVPDTPRTSILGEDMFRTLRICGLRPVRCAWGEVVDVGKHISVEVLPFFGEQPSARVPPTEDEARNWGNCYRVDTDDFSALILSDSGVDPNGNVLQGIRRSVSKRGPVDIVFGCLRYFYSPFEIEGLAAYYSALPIDGLRSDYEFYRLGRLESTTLGIVGTAVACAEAGAKIFLPYAHGLTGYQQPIIANPFGPAEDVDEATACRALQDEIRNIGGRTTVVSWNPGDYWAPSSV